MKFCPLLSFWVNLYVACDASTLPGFFLGFAVASPRHKFSPFFLYGKKKKEER